MKMPEFEKIYLAEKNFFPAKKRLKNAALLLKNRKRRDNRSVIGQKNITFFKIFSLNSHFSLALSAPNVVLYHS